MTWTFRINWRDRKKTNGSGGSLPGLYTRTEAMKLSKYLRENNPKKLYWISNTPSKPENKRDLVQIYK